MPQLIWSSGGRFHLRRVTKFLSDKNEPAGRRALAAILSGLQLLERHPAAGRPSGEPPEGSRDLLIPFSNGGYVVRYIVTEEGVVVLTIRHTLEAGF